MRKVPVVAIVLVAAAAAAIFLSFRELRTAHVPHGGFLGLEFAPLTRAAQARAPYLTTGGAMILAVVPHSPADGHFLEGEVVTAIDGERIATARDAVRALDGRRAGSRVAISYLDLSKGDGRVRTETVALAEHPPEDKTRYSVELPRMLAREWDFEPAMAAHASWSNRIARGAVNPLALKRYARGRCSALAPENWVLISADPEGNMIELMSPALNTRVAFVRSMLEGGSRAESIVTSAIARYSGITPETGAVLTTASGYRVMDFGSMRGIAGFALFRLRAPGRHGVILSIWIAAVPANNVAVLAPVAGAVALSIRCGGILDAEPRPRDPAISPTSISVRCLENRCDETDVAGAYNEEMHTGYVHAPDGNNFLIDPRKDIWATGPNGPGTYRQVNGLLQKLEPGRSN
ncbi:MAG: PDZ domain-containing protein [Alphaproteobacteria bacterium]|nr:PDZ domain-containing protein [Alphaproteobacteria bacterium]